MCTLSVEDTNSNTKMHMQLQLTMKIHEDLKHLRVELLQEWSKAYLLSQAAIWLWFPNIYSQYIPGVLADSSGALIMLMMSQV